jgi:hypothetical protein
MLKKGNRVLQKQISLRKIERKCILECDRRRRCGERLEQLILSHAKQDLHRLE